MTDSNRRPRRADALQGPLGRFALSVLVGLGILLPTALMAYFLWTVGHGFLVIAASILLAILLDGLARFIEKFTPLGHRLALLLAIVFIALLLSGSSWLGGSHVVTQAPQLNTQIRLSLGQIHDRLVEDEILPRDEASPQEGGRQPSSDNTSKALSYSRRIGGNLTNVASDVTGALADFFIILILGIYFASAPGYYLRIAAMLIPPSRREYVIQVLDTIGHALRRWFFGQLLAMILVGVLTTLGLYGLGIELYLLLGIIAGLFAFVPYLGAVISVVPAILVSLSSGPLMAVYVAVLFLLVHILEGYVFTPLVQRRTVHIAPAFLLVAQLLAGLFAGAFGIFIAAPLAIAFTIGVQKFYIETFFAESPHILGDETAGE